MINDDRLSARVCAVGKPRGGGAINDEHRHAEWSEGRVRPDVRTWAVHGSTAVLCALLGQELFFWLENGLRKNLQKMVY